MLDDSIPQRDRVVAGIRLPRGDAMTSEPPFVFGVVTDARQQNFTKPNLAHTTVGQAGNELLNYRPEL
jgi:hypothetical protein